ncbi:MAG: DEAD/DEAH box helicase family protein [Moraxellaceae bacterium]|nr:DEAD/DEAH box helicase family protein [Moraxellaceae bacterium]
MNKQPITNHQLKYFAWEITKKRSANDQDRISQSLFDAQVDVNPHQIEAALFALNNPLSKGVVLADEVGLGKTIEASLVLCQYWAEYRRKILIICPASLRKQWANELQDKFNLPVQVLDSVTWKKLRKQDIYNPFDNNKISIISYPFAVRMEYELSKIMWDMVVMDEAHKLRNAHKTSNKTGNSLKKSLPAHKKLLLTATPLQNRLTELYGLSTVIDSHLFGDEKGFRRQYVLSENLSGLKKRLEQFVHRTLRKDVLEYVPYTKRHALTIPFTPSSQEQRLYEDITAYLQEEFSYAFPIQQRHLITIVLRKLLASSTSAVITTLESIQRRLQAMLDKQNLDEDWIGQLISDDDLDGDAFDEIGDELESEEATVDVELLKREIDKVESYLKYARTIKEDEKSHALLTALSSGFAKMAEMGAKKKAVIFTESRRTQSYLINYLEAHGFAGKVVSFNGSNNSTVNTGIYKNWLAKHQGSDRLTGSSAIDRRSSLIDFFKNEAEIFIATEAASEGVNLQFCSLVINYDLPWNPQRVEQRIGRCHRYGQEFDVVVVNFLNKNNAVDTRIMELLGEKFALFEGVFGASNEILGTIGSGVDFENRIYDIYEKCRTAEEIEASFAQLRADLEAQINQKMLETRDKLFQHFDADIHQLLKIHKERAEEQLDKISQFFWIISQQLLSPFATFSQHQLRFTLNDSPLLSVKTGSYKLIRKGESIPDNTFVYRLTHPLGEYVLNKAKKLPTDMVAINFNYSHYDKKISGLELLQGHSGWLSLSLLSLNSFAEEEHLILTGVDDNGKVLDSNQCEWMLRLNGTQNNPHLSVNNLPKNVTDIIELQRKKQLTKALENNQIFFKEEQEKIENWAEDRMQSAQAQIDDIKIKIRSLKREASHANSIEEQLGKQKEIKTAEREQRKLRQNIFDIEDDIEDKRDELIRRLQQQMHQKSDCQTLFIIRWHIV